MGAERREMSKMETENSINVVTMRNPRRLLSLSDCRLFLLIFASLFFLLFLFFSNNNNNAPTHMNPFTPLITTTTPRRSNTSSSSSSMININELRRSRIAVCLVGGARRFQLTGPSIVDNILNVYPNSDLFLHSPFDSDSFKFSLLKTSPRIASVRIFKPQPILQTESQLRVLSAQNSPQGIQGLLQYFNLVEGCLTMIKSHQHQHNFTYHWIVRTRVDGFWSRPLSPDSFIPGHYVVPPGSSYGGLNDRLGVGDLNTSLVALSRLSLIPQLDSAGFQQLNSETAFKAQLMTQGVPYLTQRTPFCVVSDRRYDYPPSRYGVPVAAMSSRGPLSGAKCRPCRPVCSGSCVGEVMSGLDREWSWTEWDGGSLELCDAHGEWENGWESRFDGVAGKKLGDARKRVRGLKLDECVADFEEMRRRTANWEAPQAVEICAFGLKTR